MAPAAVISLSEGRRGGPALRLLGDRHLGRLASKGDPRAFAAIYERHHQDLYRYCRSITGNAEDASDALQNTMTAALRSLPGERREVPLRPWLFRVAHNESVSLLRRRRPAAELTEDSPSASPGPHGLACMRERVSVLVDNLRGLPERQRGALVMRELNGLGYDEIASALGISAAAARQAVYEARLALTELEEGREMECDTARRSISARDGRIMRGRRLRAHLRGCRACANFSEQVGLRRTALSSVFPPLPAAAGAALLGALFGGGGGAGAGASVGAGSGGLMSIVTGGLSHAAGASGAAKSAAAVVAVAVAGVGTVEVAKEAREPSPSGITASAPRAHAGAGTPRAGLPAKARRRAQHAPRSGGRGERGKRHAARTGGSRAIEVGTEPVRARQREPRRPATEQISAPPVPETLRAPAPAPHAPAVPPPAAQPAAPAGSQPWQVRYAEGMSRYRAGMDLVQQTMQGVQQMMSGMFSGMRQR